MDIAESLREREIFSHFSDEEIGQLARCVTRSRYPEGASIMRQGEQTQDAYLVEKGKISIQRDTPYGLYRLALLGPGELFGEVSFVDDQRRASDAVTATEAEFLVFNPVALSTLSDLDRRFSVALFWAFWKSISVKLRKTNDQLTRFFAGVEEGGGDRAALAKGATGEFRVDLEAKKQLFLEQKLSAMEINFLATLSKEKSLLADEILFREGDEGNRMYVVLEGRVMISKFIPGAGEEALAFLERGDYFGEMALIENLPRSADAKAHGGPAVVLAIDREVLGGILDIRKISSLRLLKMLSTIIAKRLRELDDKIIGWYIISGGSPSS